MNSTPNRRTRVNYTLLSLDRLPKPGDTICSYTRDACKEPALYRLRLQQPLNVAAGPNNPNRRVYTNFTCAKHTQKLAPGVIPQYFSDSRLPEEVAAWRRPSRTQRASAVPVSAQAMAEPIESQL